MASIDGGRPCCNVGNAVSGNHRSCYESRAVIVLLHAWERAAAMTVFLDDDHGAVTAEARSNAWVELLCKEWVQGRWCNVGPVVQCARRGISRFFGTLGSDGDA